MPANLAYSGTFQIAVHNQSQSSNYLSTLIPLVSPLPCSYPLWTANKSLPAFFPKKACQPRMAATFVFPVEPCACGWPPQSRTQFLLWPAHSSINAFFQKMFRPGRLLFNTIP